jgi:hypothetical protein
MVALETTVLALLEENQGIWLEEKKLCGEVPLYI